MNGSSKALVVAALILGASLLGAGFLVGRSVDRGASQLEGLRADLDGVRKVLAAGGQPGPTPSRAAQPRRPDPNRRYEIAIDEDPIKGPASAPVTIVEWSDFQCPFCRRVTPTLEQIQREYGDKVRIAFKHLPLSMHPKAPAAHAAAEAAHRQGKFWEMHDRIFENQREMSPAKYVEYAREIGLDVARFERDVRSKEIKDSVDADARMASSLGVTGTPAFFVNGRYLSGAQPFSSFKKLIDEELQGKG